MRLERVEPTGPRVPLGALYGAVLASAAAVAAVWFRAGLPRPVCPFHHWTGLPCPGCGSTRMLEALLGGDVAGALAWNPLAFAALALVSAWALLSAGRWALGLAPRRLVLEGREPGAARLASALALAGGWVYLLWRGI